MGLLSIDWSGKGSLKKWHLSEEWVMERTLATENSRSIHSRQSKQQVQSPKDRNQTLRNKITGVKSTMNRGEGQEKGIRERGMAGERRLCSIPKCNGLPLRVLSKRVISSDLYSVCWGMGGMSRQYRKPAYGPGKKEGSLSPGWCSGSVYVL